MAAPSFPHRGRVAFRFAANVFIGAAITWHTLRLLEVSNPIWAVAAMVASADPDPGVAFRMFKSRIVNVLVGCLVGLVFLLIGRSDTWKLPAALATTVLISAYLVRVPTMWRQAPITAALIIASGLSHQSAASGIVFGVQKVAEVLFGCVVGLLVSWAMARLWPSAGTGNAAEEPPP
jgi:uncharacterized membrane protein YccC